MKNKEKKWKNVRVKIFGAKWKIIFKSPEDEEMFRESEESCLDGYTDQYTHEIVISTRNGCDVKQTLRHELIHAMLFESGLGFSWEHAVRVGHEETMVDWIALQYPKIKKIFKKVGCD